MQIERLLPLPLSKSERGYLPHLWRAELIELTTENRQTTAEVLDWLRLEHGVEKPGDSLSEMHRLTEHGFIVGAEVISPFPPRFQVTVVFIDGGKPEHRAALLGGIRLIGLLGETEVEEVTRGDRVFLKLNTEEESVKVLCWRQGEHMLLTIGTEDVDHTLDLAAGKRPNLTSNPVYKQLAEFDRYETIERGFVDLERAVVIAESAYPPAAEILEKLGLRGLKQFSFHVGFKDKLIRSTIALHMPGKREGLLRMLDSDAPLDFKALPKFPPDATSVAVTRFDAGTIYESIIDAIDVSLGAFQPNEVEEFHKQLQEAQDALGIDLQQDLFDALGSTLAIYNAPSEGPLNLGMAAAIKVKDRKKLTKTLETLVNTLPATTGADVRLKKRDYHGATVYSVHIEAPGFPFEPTYTITEDGWLVVGLLPQSVQGFLYRNADEQRGGWKAPALVRAALKAVQTQKDAKVTGLSVHDPRPGVEQILSIAPILVKTITGFSGTGGDFDVGLIPPAQAVTERLTHNVTVVVDDGETVRWEGYASAPLPSQFTGLDSYALLIVFSFGRVAF